MRADNSRFIVQAARRRRRATRERAVQALRHLAAKGDPVTFDAVARAAGVSRSWLYAQPDLRLEIGRLRAQQRERQGLAPGSPPVPAHQRASDASLRRRLEAANAENRRLREENRQLREQLAWALGEHRAGAIRTRAARQHQEASARSRPGVIGPCS